MIRRTHLTACQTHAPWPKRSQIEQDLRISRSMAAIFPDPVLGEHLAMRGGTVLHKAHLAPAARYSEDIDLVLVKAMATETLDRHLRRVLAPVLGQPADSLIANAWLAIRNVVRPSRILRTAYRFVPVGLRREETIKVEVNLNESASLYPLVGVELDTLDDDGEHIRATVRSYDINEMLGTKTRALMQREQGRDLFDLFHAWQLSEAGTTPYPVAEKPALIAQNSALAEGDQALRGEHREDGGLFSYVSLEERVPKRHPVRKMRRLVDSTLTNLDERFDEIYASDGRPSIPPERLIRASLLQVLYSIHSERQLMEQLDYHLMFRWFVDLNVDEPGWNPSTFSKNRDRLATADMGRRLFDEIVGPARRHGLTSDEHFSVDGVLIAAWASQKSVRRKGGDDDDNPDGVGRNAGRNFQGERRSNKTHASRTDPEALISSKSRGIAARPSYAGHTLMENRNGLLVDAELTQATGTAERDAAADMASALRAGATLGADKAYDTHGFVAEMRALRVTPHVAQNLNRPGGSAIDGGTTRHPGCVVSQRVRKRVEEPFGWAKQIGGFRQTKHRGLARVRQEFLKVMAAYNIVRIKNLLPATAW